MSAFDTYRYIQRRMKAAGIKKDDVSCDCDDRILITARRALKKDWYTGKRTEEMIFTKVGKLWASSLIQI